MAGPSPMFVVGTRRECGPSNKPIDRPPRGLEVPRAFRPLKWRSYVLRWYLGARFGRSFALEAIDINAGDDVEVGLSREDRGISK